MTENQRNYYINQRVTLNVTVGESLGLLKLTHMKVQECLNCLTNKNCDPCRRTVLSGNVLIKTLMSQLAQNGINKKTVDELLMDENKESEHKKIINQIKYN